MAKCPHCKTEMELSDVRKEVSDKDLGEIMYVCPKCDSILGFGKE